jgi:chromate transporter
VAGALRGMGAGAAGLMFGTALKLAETFKSNPMRIAGCIAFAAATFIAVAILRLPLIWVLPGLGIPASLFAAWRLIRSSHL